MRNYPTLSEIQVDLKKNSLSCVQLVNYYLERIDTQSSLNSFAEVFTEDALDRASAVDQKLKKGNAGKLAGLVIGIKDNLCYKDHHVSASSEILDGFRSTYSATAVQRLIDEDAIIIGRQNCDEFGMGSSNQNSRYGPVHNGIDHERIPGGSSGGSAVSVQMDMCQVSIGSDTGGSVRQPAALCGIIGLKPTYSRISRYGLLAYASSFDCIGIISKSIDDCGRVLEVIAGPDPNDSTSHSNGFSFESEYIDPGSTSIAVLKDSLNDPDMDPDVGEIIHKQVESLRSKGFQIREVEFPMMEYVLPAYYVLCTAEASSNLSRYDGVKFGIRSDDKDLESMYKSTRTKGFGEEVRRRIMLGTFALSARYYDAYYLKALKVRTLIRNEMKRILNDVDYVLLPTTPHTASLIGQKRTPVQEYLEDQFTVTASLAGLPSVSVPAGQDQKGLPVGLQLIADDFNENALFALSDYILSLKNA